MPPILATEPVSSGAGMREHHADTLSLLLPCICAVPTVAMLDVLWGRAGMFSHTGPEHWRHWVAVHGREAGDSEKGERGVGAGAAAPGRACAAAAGGLQERPAPARPEPAPGPGSCCSLLVLMTPLQSRSRCARCAVRAQGGLPRCRSLVCM